MTDEKDQQPIERGAAEDASGVAATPTEVEASRTPPSQPDDEPEVTTVEPTD